MVHLSNRVCRISHINPCLFIVTFVVFTEKNRPFELFLYLVVVQKLYQWSSNRLLNPTGLNEHLLVTYCNCFLSSEPECSKIFTIIVGVTKQCSAFVVIIVKGCSNEQERRSPPKPVYTILTTKECGESRTNFLNLLVIRFIAFSDSGFVQLKIA